jgi:hypothetical protein
MTLKKIGSIYVDTSKNHQASFFFDPEAIWAGTPSGSVNGLLTDIKGYWKLDGDFVDASINGNDGTNVNTTNEATGVINQGRAFSGANQYFTIPDTIKTAIGSGDFTISGWHYITSVSSSYDDCFIGGGTDAKITFNTSGIFVRTANGGGSVTATWTPISASFFHIAIVKTSNVIEVFINGVSKGGGTLNEAFEFNRFGINSTTNQPLNGKMDEVGIWTKALTSEQITSLYNSGSGLAFSEFD